MRAEKTKKKLLQCESDYFRFVNENTSHFFVLNSKNINNIHCIQIILKMERREAKSIKYSPEG